MPEVMVRGTPVDAFWSFLNQELTPAQLTTILGRHSSREFAKQFSTKILASELFSLAYVNELTCLAAEAKGEAPDRFGERAGHFSARLGLDKPAYRPFFRFLSVANALRVAPMMWSRVYTDGKLTVEARTGSARLIATQFPGNIAGCARATGWFRYIAEKSGAERLTVTHATCTAKGAREDVWEFTWNV